MKKINNSYTFGRTLSYIVTITIIFATSFFGAQTVQAADWRFDPVIRVGYEYDDNATLNAIAAPIEIEGYLIEGSVTIGSATQRTTIDITPMIRSRNYDVDIFDSDDVFLTLNYNHEGLKSNFRIRANYADEAVRTAERADADPNVDDPDEIVGDDTGSAFAIDNRQRLWIMPQWSYDFSERTTLAARATYIDVDYDDLITGLFTPYSDVRIEASLSRGFSTRTRGYIKASARRYEPDTAGIGGAVDVDGFAFNLGLERGLTQTTRFRAEIGVEESEPAGGASDSNVVWDINLVNKLQTVTVLAQVKRSVNASGAGRVSLRDSFNLNLKKQFSDRLDGGLGIRAYSTERLSSDPGTIDERDYIQFLAQMTYALSRTFSVQADYRYTYIDRSTVADTAKSNSIILWLTWQPNAMTTSR